MDKINKHSGVDYFKDKPATLEEINENWDTWWNQLTDSEKSRLAAEAEYFIKENIEKLPGPWN
tara:strand:- start:87 stop:275 length:189 start_codon:yes stop_codon:yes gene_type:complete